MQGVRLQVIVPKPLAQVIHRAARQSQLSVSKYLGQRLYELFSPKPEAAAKGKK